MESIFDKNILIVIDNGFFLDDKCKSFAYIILVIN